MEKAISQPVIRYSAYALVWLGLLGLTWLTVTVAGLEIGALNVVVPFLIASLKAFMVLAFFMHLRYEKGLIRLIVLAGIAVFLVLGWLVWSDVAYRGQ
ncbi:MAG: cytochrome C oxidase subunit IV family protein [Deltaproteobacteria bacterium]|nr:cytochrome C oxidase subunit IV family protein [Deltaproteobacteria bacterium]